MPFVANKNSNKGVFQYAKKYVVKIGTDLSVGKDGINNDFLHNTATQISRLNQQQIGVVLVTSGAVKLGRLVSKKVGVSKELSKSEAAFAGYSPLVESWRQTLANQGLFSKTLVLTGQNFTQRNLSHLKKLIDKTSVTETIITNTHDGLNVKRFKYFAQANNNDVVGEKFASLCAHTYVICTNVDGVLDKDGNTIRNFQSLEQLKDITFYKDRASNGTGGMEAKLQAAINFSLSGGVTYIVNGKESDILLKVHRGEQVGTRVELKQEVCCEQ